MIVANATGCSSIYGANLPTTPWTVNAAGRGPAWSNSLFEDNAEFGLGMRLALDAQTDQARRLLERLAPEIGEDLVARAARRRAGHRGRDRRSSASRVDRLREALGGSRVRPLPMPAHLLTLAVRPRPPGRLDHRRRRLGVRHRLRRPRPGPVVGPQRQHPGPRHGGLLEHRRPGLEGDAARRRRQVRGRRQGHGQEGPRRDRAVVRQRLRGPGLDGRQRPADHQGAARGGRLAGPVAGHRLQHVHRPRHRHVEVDEPPEGRGQERLLAALPVPPVARSRTASRSSSTRRRRRSRSPTSWRPRRASRSSSGRTRNEPPSSPTLAQADADERWRYYEQLAGIERTVPHVHRPDPAIAARGRERRRLPVRRAKETRHDASTCAPATSASSSARRSSPRRRRTTATRPWPGGSNAPASARSSCRRCSRRRSSPRRSSSTRSLEQGTEVFAEALDYFPAIQSFAGAADRYLAALERVKASVAIPVIASLNASTAGRLGRAMPGASRTPAPTRSSSTCTTSRPIRGGPRPTWRRATSS